MQRKGELFGEILAIAVVVVDGDGGVAASGDRLRVLIGPARPVVIDTALDLVGITKMSTMSGARYASQLLRSTEERGPRGKYAVALHDLTDFTLQSQAPLPFQVDGDHLGLRTSATFTGVRRALRVIV